METLNELFEDTLKDVYFAENEILKALPKMAKKRGHSEVVPISSFDQPKNGPTTAQESSVRFEGAHCRWRPAHQRYEPPSSSAHILCERCRLILIQPGWQLSRDTAG